MKNDTMLPNPFRSAMRVLGEALLLILMIGVLTFASQIDVHAAEWKQGGGLKTEPNRTFEPIEVATELQLKFTEECLKETARTVPPEKVHYAAAMYSACMAKRYVQVNKAAIKVANEQELLASLGGI